MGKKRDFGTSKRAARRLAHTAESLDSKELGDLGELAFILAAGSMGLAVSKPFGDSRRYDLIVDSGRRMLRVQVKSVYRRAARGDYQVTCCSRAGQSGSIIYTAKEIDVMAVYLAPIDIWYLIPVAALGTVTVIHLHPHGIKNRVRGSGRFEIYKEAWEQLDERQLAEQ